MKMNSAQIKQTLQQFQARTIPAGHSVMSQLERLFGDHTYFLDGKGLNIVEPVDTKQDGGIRAVVVNLASWADESEGNLEPHTPRQRIWSSTSNPSCAIDGTPWRPM